MILTLSTNKYDWIIYEKVQGSTKGFFQIWCTRLFMSKQSAFDNIELVCKALDYYNRRNDKNERFDI